MINYTDEFELFFRSYPPRYNESRNVWIRGDKQGAFLEWQKLTKDEMIAALEAVQKEKSGKYTPDARKWLKHKRWEDIVVPVRYQKPLPAEIQEMVDKIAKGFKKVPKVGMGNYAINKKRNAQRDKLNL